MVWKETWRFPRPHKRIGHKQRSCLVITLSAELQRPDKKRWLNFIYDRGSPDLWLQCFFTFTFKTVYIYNILTSTRPRPLNITSAFVSSVGRGNYSIRTCHYKSRSDILPTAFPLAAWPLKLYWKIKKKDDIFLWYPSSLVRTWSKPSDF